MDRYQTLLQLKNIYEEILQGGDGRVFLQREEEVDNLFLILLSREDEEYSQLEMDMLKVLSELNHSMESLLNASMNQMKRNHVMSSKVSKQYDAPTLIDSYFYDRKS